MRDSSSGEMIIRRGGGEMEIAGVQVGEEFQTREDKNNHTLVWLSGIKPALDSSGQNENFETT